MNEKKPRRNSIEARLQKLPHPMELVDLSPEEKISLLEKQKELSKISDEGLRNYQKNMNIDYDTVLNKSRLSNEVDDLATMGSDTRGIVYKDNPNYDYKAAEKAARPHKINRLAAEQELAERGYETLLGTRSKDLGRRNPSKLINKSTGKILKSLGILGTLGAGLTVPDMASAAADVVIPGGVEDLGVSDEQKALDKLYFKKLRDKLK